MRVRVHMQVVLMVMVMLWNILKSNYYQFSISSYLQIFNTEYAVVVLVLVL